MNPSVQRIIMQKPPIIPNSIKPNVLAWWDARKRNDVVYGLTNGMINGNITSTDGWTSPSTISASGNVLTVSGDLNPIYAEGSTNLTLAAGKKYYVVARVRKTDAIAATELRLSFNGSTSGTTTQLDTQASAVQNEWYTLSGVATVTDQVGTLLVRIYEIVAGTKTMQVEKVMAFPLSDDIGLGNEPTSAEMDAILAADKAASKVKYVLTEGDIASFITSDENIDRIYVTPPTGIVANKVGALTVSGYTEYTGADAAYDAVTSIGKFHYQSTYFGSNRITLFTAKGAYVDLAAAKAALTGTEIWYELESLYWEGTRQVKCNPDYKYYLYDYSGNGRHMKLNNFAWTVDSGWAVPPALVFEGTDDYGNITNAVFDNYFDGFSVSAWFYPKSYKIQRILTKDEDGTSYIYSIVLRDDGDIYCVVQTSVQYYGATSIPGFKYTTNKWQHIIMTFDGVTIKGYLNGQQKSSINVTGTAKANSLTNLYIGRKASAGEFYDGMMDRVGYINKALSNAEVYAIWKANRKDFGL